MFIGRTDADAPVFWSLNVKSWLTGKDPDAEKDWKQKEKGVEEDEMVRQHHCLIGHECEQTPGDSGGQRSLCATVLKVACYRLQRVRQDLATEQQQQEHQSVFLWLWCVFQNFGNNRVISILYNDTNSVLHCYKYIVLSEAGLPGGWSNLKVRLPSHTVQMRPLITWQMVHYSLQQTGGGKFLFCWQVIPNCHKHLLNSQKWRLGTTQ